MGKCKIGNTIEVVGGKLTYLGDTDRRAAKKEIIGRWQCIDDCPYETKEFEAINTCITSGKTQSCGCLKSRWQKEKIKIIKETDIIKNNLQSTYCRIKERCYDKNYIKYHRYGGRGISMQEDWVNDYDKFEKDLLEKIGPKPSKKYSIDRINNDGNYQIDNIRWASDEQQSRNKSTNRIIDFDGTKKLLCEWSEEYGVDRRLIVKRINRGWKGKKILEKPKTRKEKQFPTDNFYDMWANIKQRCYNENNNNYSDYGAKGVKLYSTWHKYKVFQKYIVDNIGKRPSSEHSLDRIKNEKGYEPDNIRWATYKQQANNKTNTIYVEYQNDKMPLTEAAEKSGIDYNILFSRYKDKISPEKLFLPPKTKK